MYCHFCAEPLLEGHRGIYCEGGECKRAANNAKKNRRAQRICRLCGRGPGKFNRALWKLYQHTRQYLSTGVHLPSQCLLDQMQAAIKEIEEIRATARAERAAQQKAEEVHAQTENA